METSDKQTHFVFIEKYLNFEIVLKTKAIFVPKFTSVSITVHFYDVIITFFGVSKQL